MSEDVMEVPLLNFNNYEVHPVDKKFMVFYFSQVEAARHFEILLTKEDIFFEKDETEDARKTYVFGIKRRDFRKVNKLNDITKGMHRERTISNRYVGITILILTSFLIAIAILGYLTSKA